MGGPTVTKAEIDSVLHDFDMSLSGYIPKSTVSILNYEDGFYTVPKKDKYFISCMNIAMDIYKKTDGAFDPTVLPLLRIWGFLQDQDQLPTNVEIDSTLKIIGFEQKHLWDWEADGNSKRIEKYDPRLEFDFNAIAQGYSVDVIAEYLKEKGCKNIYVEIGGEIYVQGSNPEGGTWRLGVDKPIESNDGIGKRVISAVIGLPEGGIATSGNYRKFYEKDGKKYAHTINPKTGRPAENEILSATVIAKNAAIADGMATAFMVMGLEETKEFIRLKNTDHLDVLIIYTNDQNELETWTTSGMNKFML